RRLTVHVPRSAHHLAAVAVITCRGVAFYGIEDVPRCPGNEHPDVIRLPVPLPVEGNEIARFGRVRDRETVAPVVSVREQPGNVVVAITRTGTLGDRVEARRGLADIVGAQLVGPRDEDRTPRDAIFAVPVTVLLHVRACR